MTFAGGSNTVGWPRPEGHECYRVPPWVLYQPKAVKRAPLIAESSKKASQVEHYLTEEVKQRRLSYLRVG
jgi:hypothetical protein